MFETLRKHRVDPEVEREITVIDLAVANGDTGRPEDAELTDFAMRLRGTRPLPDAGEIVRLDARIAEIESGASADDSKPSRRNPRKLALAGLGACFVVGMVGISVATFSHSQDDSAAPSETIGDRGNGLGTTDEAPGQSQGTSTDSSAAEADLSLKAKEVAPASPALDDFVGKTRVQTRATEITLATPVDEVETVSDKVIATTDRYGGYVNQSNVTGGDADSRASLDLRIPASDYQDALASISALGHVRERVQDTSDITGQYRRAETAVERAQRNRDRLARQRAAAETQAEKDALTIRLRRAQRRLNVEQQMFNQLDSQVKFVAMSVSIIGDDAAATSDESRIGAAWRISKSALTTIAGALIVLTAIALPFLLLGLLGFFGTRSLRRRRGESAIDGAAAKDAV